MFLFTVFYTTARMCGVLAILTNTLTFGWLLGYTLEKLLEYDPCTIGSLLGLNGLTGTNINNIRL